MCPYLPGGIELVHVIVKGQMKNSSGAQTPAEQFYSLANKHSLLYRYFPAYRSYCDRTPASAK
jgi:hypothetical protein